MNSSSSITKLAPALLAAQKQMTDAKKDAKNPFYKSKYADLNSVREAVTPALHANGISILQPTVHVDGRNFVQTMLLHESGEYLTSNTEIICKEASNPQALGSAISYSRRYGLSSMLSVGASDDDSEIAMGRGAKVNSLSQRTELTPGTGTGAISLNNNNFNSSVTHKTDVPSTTTITQVVTPKASFRKPKVTTETPAGAEVKKDSENVDDWIS